MDNKENVGKPVKNHETAGYGYDKSIDDLKVIGKNNDAKKKKNNNSPMDKKTRLE